MGEKCKMCEQPAVANYQHPWYRYSYDANTGTYGIPEWMDWAPEESLFFCEKHSQEFEQGETQYKEV